MARKIYDVDISEITLCKSPANKKLFFIKKSQEKPMKELIEDLKKYMAEDDEDAEKALTEEQIAKAEKIGDKEAKALKEALKVVSQYEEIPDDLEGALMTLVKQASIDYPVIEEELGKAGAKLSKTTQAQIKEALGHIKDGPKAVAILETLLGIETKKTVKGKEGDKEENLSVETLKKLEEYEELKKAKDEQDKKDDQQKQDERVVDLINKALKDAGLDEIPQKKSIDEPTDDKEDKKDKKKEKGVLDDSVDNFPSIPIPDLSQGD